MQYRGRTVALALVLLAVSPATALVPDAEVVALPEPLVRGGIAVLAPPAPGPVPARAVDGDLTDWWGRSTRLAGTVVLDRGELVYQDHLFDDTGADDGADAARVALLAPLTRAGGRAHRADVLPHAVGAELGLEDVDPTNGVIAARGRYGDARYPGGAEGHADLLEVRLAADGERAFLLARTVTMTDPARVAILLLADTRPGSEARDVPFGSGLATTRADVAVLLTATGARVADLVAGTVRDAPDVLVALVPHGFTNAVEASFPLSLVAHLDDPEGAALKVAVAAGAHDGAGGLARVVTGTGRANVLNVAYRIESEARERMDKAQALALHAGTVDAFFARADVSLLRGGFTESWTITPGYHERVFESSPLVAVEQGEHGLHQPYGLYVPSGWSRDRDAPLTLWLHWRGGGAHSAAAFTPRALRTLAEETHGIVVAPHGRGASTWFVGAGHVDVLDAWADARATFRVDENRTYVAGYSMGGFGSYLFALLYPDRFAAAFVVSGATTQGAWLGVDARGRDVVEANGGDARAQLVHRVLENARGVPIVVHHGAADQLVPVSGVARVAARLTELGYRHRLVVFPEFDHYGQAIADEWADGARYLAAHARDDAPSRVTFKRVPALERAVETVSARGATLDFDVDGAHWLDGLRPRDGDAADPESHALADVTSRARPEAHLLVPVAGAAAPGHSVPFVMTGLAWLPVKSAAPSNGLDATLRNAASVTLDLADMGLAWDVPVDARVVTDGLVELRLAGGWLATPRVTVNGADAPARLEGGVLVVPLDEGEHEVRVEP